MIVEILNWDDKVVGEQELDDGIFANVPRPDIVHRVVCWQLAKRRAGTHSTKEIGDVQGSTRKIYSQKGSGRARHGAIRAPQFRKGGVVFGPLVRSHAFKMNKKVRVLALSLALSAKIDSGALTIIDSAMLTECKTACLLKRPLLGRIAHKSLTLIVDHNPCNELKKSSANARYVNMLPTCGLNVYDLLKHKNLIMTVAAVKEIHSRLGNA